MTYRNQWAELGNSSPKTYSIRFNRKITFKKLDLWVGGYFLGDEVGPSQFTGGYLTAALHYPLTTGHFIRVGFSLGGLGHALNEEYIYARDPGDPLLAQRMRSELFWDPSLGIYYSGPWYYIGASMPHLINFTLSGQQTRANP